MNGNNIYDHEMIKNDKKYKKVYLNYPPETDWNSKLICDCCDEPRHLASITMLCGDVACICKGCLLEIVSTFDTDVEWIKYLEKGEKK